MPILINLFSLFLQIYSLLFSILLFVRRLTYTMTPMGVLAIGLQLGSVKRKDNRRSGGENSEVR